MSYLSKKGSSHIVHDLKDQNGGPFWEMLEDEKAYKREEGLLQILDNLTSGLFTVDKKGRINYFNAAAGQITGFSASDATGMQGRIQEPCLRGMLLPQRKNRVGRSSCQTKTITANFLKSKEALTSKDFFSSQLARLKDISRIQDLQRRMLYV